MYLHTILYIAYDYNDSEVFSVSAKILNLGGYNFFFIVYNTRQLS